MSDRLITVASYEFVYQAQLAQTVLKNEGIDSFAEGLEVVNMDWGLSNAIRNIKLQTSESDADKARAILSQTQIEKPELDDFTCLSCGGEMNVESTICSECGWSFTEGSEELYHPDKNRDSGRQENQLEQIRPFAKTLISGYLFFLLLTIVFVLVVALSTFLQSVL